VHQFTGLAKARTYVCSVSFAESSDFFFFVIKWCCEGTGALGEFDRIKKPFKLLIAVTTFVTCIGSSS